MTTCPTCGQLARIVSSDEGTSHFEPPEAVAVLAEALIRNGIAYENVASMGNADQWLPDTDLARAILAALREAGWTLENRLALSDEMLRLIRENGDRRAEGALAAAAARVAELPVHYRRNGWASSKAWIDRRAALAALTPEASDVID